MPGTYLAVPWVVISGVFMRVATVITHINGHITLLITTHEWVVIIISRVISPLMWVITIATPIINPTYSYP